MTRWTTCPPPSAEPWGWRSSAAGVAGFTNSEEEAAGLTEVVPFLLADRLTELGATHVPGPDFTENVVADGRLVTGQNPQSAAGVARAVLAAR